MQFHDEAPAHTQFRDRLDALFDDADVTNIEADNTQRTNSHHSPYPPPPPSTTTQTTSSQEPHTPQPDTPTANNPPPPSPPPPAAAAGVRFASPQGSNGSFERPATERRWRPPTPFYVSCFKQRHVLRPHPTKHLITHLYSSSEEITTKAHNPVLQMHQCHLWERPIVHLCRRIDSNEIQLISDPGRT